ncbi:MAG: hypothetical protein N2376_03975 [Clostridia bacterium]|nr:hypothetical protein [Clostridia bacterium]
MKSKAQNLKDRVKPKPSAESVQKSCNNCLKSTSVGFTKDLLCREKGVVSADYCCSSHRYFIRDDLKKAEVLHCSECEFFVFHTHATIPTYGVCDMFSVRKCDGSQKKACSKFVRRKEQSA